MNIDLTKLPQHIAIIMDGNGRWAKNRNLPRIFGHREGAKRVEEIVKSAVELRIQCLSLYAFSSENWSRPKNEIKGLFSLLEVYLKKEISNMQKKNIKFIVSGDISRLDKRIVKLLNNTIDKLKNNTGMILNICINYGGRQEIINAVNKIITSGKKKVSVENFSEYLYTKDLPEPDLLIRTSGELRISNFMLWQLAYTELYFTKTLWPDFNTEEFYKAIVDYQSRERRFGRVV